MTSDTHSGPLVVPVTTAERVDRYGVGVAAKYEEGVAVSVNGAGTVTRMPVAVGDLLDSGSVVVIVDDTPIVAYVSDGPLWRDLEPGVKGEDVARLQRFLSDVGLYDGRADGEVGTATARAVKAFNKAHGREDLGATFAMSSVAWVGPSAVRVATLEVAAGATIGAGSVIVRGPRRATSITVTEPTGGIPPGSEYQLTVTGTATPYVPGSGVVTDPDVVAAVTASLGTTGEGAGQVMSVDAEPVLRVPASAIVVDPSGASCVFESAVGDPIAVTVRGGTLASADLATGIALTHVLVNPLAVLEEPTCGSSPKA
ncbi:MAG: peptidoglycan-binding domain-containing protein [Cellulomonas sp.]